MFQVTAMRMGSFRLVKEFYDFDPGHEIEQPIWSALIQGEGRNIVVDTGLHDRDWLERHALPTTIKPEEHMARALETAGGITPDDVDTVILTHLHYDHIGNNRLFQNAAFYVTKTEYDFAWNPLPCQAFLYSRTRQLFDERSVAPEAWRFVTEDMELLPGLRLILTPGHTEGHMSVLVETEEGVLCIAGDAVNFMEILTENRVNGLHISVRDCYASVQKIRDLADRILPGHDEQYLQNFQSKNFPLIPK